MSTFTYVDYFVFLWHTLSQRPLYNLSFLSFPFFTAVDPKELKQLATDEQLVHDLYGKIFTHQAQSQLQEAR